MREFTGVELALPSSWAVPPTTEIVAVEAGAPPVLVAWVGIVVVEVCPNCTPCDTVLARLAEGAEFEMVMVCVMLLEPSADAVS